MSYKQIEKISVNMFRFSDIFILKHVIRLTKKNNKGSRQYMHSEYSYKSNKYGRTDYLTSITLDFHPYLLIEQINTDWANRENVSLNYIGLTRFKNGLSNVIDWFINDEYRQLYYYEKNQLKLNVELGLKEMIHISEKSSILFRPTVIEIEGVRYEGVMMYVNTDIAVARITLDQLFTLHEMIKGFDLYNASLSLISYLGRPDFGEFKTVMGNDNNRDDEFVDMSTLGKKSDPIKEKYQSYFKC